MFTGIIEEMGSLVSRHGGRHRFASDGGIVTLGTEVGDSISVSGCCLTVVDIGERWFATDVVDETRSRTTIGALAPGDPVNLERAMRLSDRLGGHLVAGHVDAVGEVLSAAPLLRVKSPSTPLIAQKGSITVDGVSLTVVDLEVEGFSVAVIPHTAEVTTLGRVRPGSMVNVEYDLIARHIERLVQTERRQN